MHTAYVSKQIHFFLSTNVCDICCCSVKFMETCDHIYRYFGDNKLLRAMKIEIYNVCCQILLNQVLRLVRTWFLKIDPVQIVSMCGRVYVCLCLRL